MGGNYYVLDPLPVSQSISLDHLVPVSYRSGQAAISQNAFYWPIQQTSVPFLWKMLSKNYLIFMIPRYDFKNFVKAIKSIMKKDGHIFFRKYIS